MFLVQINLEKHKIKILPTHKYQHLFSRFNNFGLCFRILNGYYHKSLVYYQHCNSFDCIFLLIIIINEQ